MAKRPVPREVQELEDRALKHEGAIRQRLDERGGITGPEMQSLIQLFSNWRHQPQPDELHGALELIQKLELLSLPEHRYGVAGAVMAVGHLMPDHLEYLRQNFRKLIGVIEKIAPHLPQGDVLKPEEVEYLWMYWMVTGSPNVLTRVAGLAVQSGPIGKHAVGYLLAHGYLPEVAERLQMLEAQESMIAGTPVPGQSVAAPRPGVSKHAMPVKEVHELVEKIMALPGGRQRAVQVGWIPALDAYVIFSRDGHTLIDAPSIWRGKQVLTKKASAEQLAVHRTLLDAADEV